jgi:CRP/FNR family transcriptional regulator, cyclic AMP receptor protein
MEKTIALLQQSILFTDLSEAQIGKIIGIAKAISLPKDSLIMTEGAAGDSLFIVLKGTVEVIKSLTLDGLDETRLDRNKTFTKLSADAGDIVFGEIALLEKSQRTATVRTVTDCTLYEIGKNDFMRLAESDLELGFRVFRNLAAIVSSRLRKADEEVLKLATVLSIVLKE